MTKSKLIITEKHFDKNIPFADNRECPLARAAKEIFANAAYVGCGGIYTENDKTIAFINPEFNSDNWNEGYNKMIKGEKYRFEADLLIL